MLMILPYVHVLVFVLLLRSTKYHYITYYTYFVLLSWFMCCNIPLLSLYSETYVKYIVHVYMCCML